MSNLPSSFLDALRRRTGIEPKHFPDIGMKLAKTISFFGAIMVPISFILYYAIMDPAKLNVRPYLPSIGFILPLALIFYYFNKNELSLIPQKQFVTLIILMFLVGIFIYYGSTVSASTVYYISKMSYILIVLIGIIGLAIVFLLFTDFFKKQSGLLGFFFNLLFYIPCLLIEAFQYLKKEFQTTPSTLFILFVIELLLIIYYFANKKWLHQLTILDENLMQETPLPLDQENIIAKSNTFIYNVINPDNPSYKNNNYAISFWVYVNPNNSSDEYNILSYGNGKPQFTYKPDTNDMTVYFSDAYLDLSANTSNRSNLFKTDLAHTIKFTPQKWVHVVTNYFNNRADLFIDGLFEYSFALNGNKFPLAGNSLDTMYTGDKNAPKGAGAISRISYYQEILTEIKINRMYYMSKNKNPP